MSHMRIKVGDRAAYPAHLGCNVKKGDPTRKQADPAPVGVTRW